MPKRVPLDKVRRIQELRRSAAAGPQDNTVSRSQQRRLAIQDWEGEGGQIHDKEGHYLDPDTIDGQVLDGVEVVTGTCICGDDECEEVT